MTELIVLLSEAQVRIGRIVTGLRAGDEEGKALITLLQIIADLQALVLRKTADRILRRPPG